MEREIYTSSGTIRNPDKPRVGVIGSNSEKLNDWIYEEIDSGIDLTFEEYQLELEESGKSEEEIEKELEFYETDCRTILFGKAWKKDKEGKYIIDKTSNSFAAVYDSNSGNITVEWSAVTRRCHHTSPCYVMADGSGPCGDLDTNGDSVLAFDLPREYYKEGEENEEA